MSRTRRRQNGYFWWVGEDEGEFYRDSSVKMYFKNKPHKKITKKKRRSQWQREKSILFIDQEFDFLNKEKKYKKYPLEFSY